MAGMDFSDFLSKMTNETSGKKKQQSNINEGTMRHGGHKPQAQTPRPKTKPKPKSRPIVEEENEEDYEEEETMDYSQQEERPKKKSKIDEEFMDKAYDYAQGIIKVVRNNFKSTEERVVMLREIQKATAFYLQSVGAEQNSQSFQSPVNHSSNDMFASNSPQMSESEWENMPRVQNEQSSQSVQMNDLTGGEVNIQPSKPLTGDYNPNLKLGIKVAPDGKQEADLSGVTQTDINEMRLLAGMIGPEAEQKSKEMQAAKEQTQIEMNEREN